MRFILTRAIVVLLFFAFADDADAQLFRRWSKFKGRRHSKIFKRAKVGFGLPYGGFFGVNTEVGAKYVAFNAGLGWFPARNATTMSTAGWSVGLLGYAMKPESKLRFRMGFNYGVNGVYYEEDGNGFNVATGPSFIIGLEHEITDGLLYDMGLSVPFRGTNSYRPVAKDLEYGAFPSLGVGFTF